jgi:hypothetical protein
MSFSLESFICQKNSMGYVKNGERKEKYPCQKGMREKNACQRA